ncbi:acyl carrier protein [Actinosynnema sp. NPDC023658]|uniref:acyl carrier protein n=1 Tax=Actinosynnema sp. NPDC023658 TaxID=3155465 RepID=UPI0033E4B286
MADLKRVLREAAGVDESVDFDGDIADVDFTDLGYDSIALLETTSRVEREYGVTLAEDAVVTSTNPRRLLALINDSLDRPA